MAKKYLPLENFLKHQIGDEVRMTFAEIEEILGGKLPPSAYIHRPWWANEAAGHIHAKAWLAAGFRTAQVDMEGRTLVFSRLPVTPQAEKPRGLSDEAREFAHDAQGEDLPRHPLLGALKGTFTIEPGWDLTRPALDPDELAEWEENIDRMADRVEARLSRESQ